MPRDAFPEDRGPQPGRPVAVHLRDGERFVPLTDLAAPLIRILTAHGLVSLGDRIELEMVPGGLIVRGPL